MSSKSTPKTFVFSTAGDDTAYARRVAKKRAKIDDAVKRYFECDWSQLPPIAYNPWKGSTSASASASDFWPLKQEAFWETQIDMKPHLRTDADFAQNDELVRKRSVLERKLAEAERHVSEEPTNASAWLARLSAAEEVSERAQVQQLWQSALQAMAKSDTIGLSWVRYIQFLCRTFDTFSVTRLEENVAEGLKTLYVLLATIDNDQSRLADIEVSIVVLIWMLASELARAGFTERGLAVLQATFELAVNNVITEHTWPKVLEDFWESEFVRLGDSSLSGMSRWYAETKGMRAAPVSSLSEEPASARFYHVEPPPISEAVLEDSSDPPRRSAMDPEDSANLKEAEDPRTSAAPSEDGKSGIVVDDETEALLMKFDGSIRSLQSDGTVYSLKHGYRIDIRETDAASIYDRIKSKLAKAYAQADGTPARITNRHATSSEATPGIEGTALLKESVASALIAWASSEEALDSAQWAPVYSRQAPDVKTCEPERIVSFSEISHFVYPLWSVASKRHLLLCILKFVGLCCPRSGSFALSKELSSPEAMTLGDDEMPSPDERQTVADPTIVVSPGLQNSQSAQAFVRNLLIYSAQQPRLGGIHPEENSLQESVWATQLKCAILRFEANIVSSLRRAGHPSEDSVHLQRNNLLNTLRQTSRDALSLEYWRAYIDFECLVDNRVEALRVCYGTISMSQSLPAADPKSLSELYWTCTRIHLYSNLLSKESPPQVANRAQILHVLACFAEDEHSKMTPTFLHAACAPTAERIEALRKRYSVRLATAVTQSKEMLAAPDLTISIDNTLLLVPVAACFAWFEFFAHDVSSGLGVFDQGVGLVKQLMDKYESCSKINLDIAVLEISRVRLEALKKEMVFAASKKHSIWFRTTILNPHRKRRAAVSRKKTKVQYSRLVHSHPGSKRHWLLAFREPTLLRSFDASELADILNQLLERGIRLRDPRIVAHLQ